MLFTDRSVNGAYRAEEDCIAECFDYGNCDVVTIIYYSFVSVLMAFALLGIGNTILQVSLNPLLLDVVSKDKVTSMLTLGQFIKAISSTLGPVIAGVAAGLWGIGI